MLQKVTCSISRSVSHLPMSAARESRTTEWDTIL